MYGTLATKGDQHMRIILTKLKMLLKMPFHRKRKSYRDAIMAEKPIAYYPLSVDTNDIIKHRAPRL
jgi:hypothetical protein